MASITLSFSMNSETDRDIIEYYDKLPKGEKSREFVRVHKIHLDNAGITLADLAAKLDRILERLTSVQVSYSSQPIAPQASPGVDLSKLDNLGV